MRLLAIIIILSILDFAILSPKLNKLDLHNLYKPVSTEITNKSKPKIIGGHEAQAHSIPFQAFLEVQGDRGGWYCGGSLISQNYVMTAGHCVEGAITIYAILGAHKIFEDEDTQVNIFASDFIVHEDYNNLLLNNDIAVIKLQEPANLTDAIQIVNLPKKSVINNTFAGLSSTISGWGFTSGASNDLSEVLNYVDVEVITNQQCEESYGDLPESIICTSGKVNTGPCIGDFGGPVVLDGTQIGIVSFVAIDCLQGYPSGHTRVDRFLDWIASNTDVSTD